MNAPAKRNYTDRKNKPGHRKLRMAEKTTFLLYNTVFHRCWPLHKAKIQMTNNEYTITESSPNMGGQELQAVAQIRGPRRKFIQFLSGRTTKLLLNQ